MITKFPLFSRSAIIEVVLSPCLRRREIGDETAIDGGVTCRLMIDTGATLSVVDVALVKTLGIELSKVRRVAGIARGGETAVSKVDATLTMQLSNGQGLKLPSILIGCCVLSEATRRRCDGVLGLDLLQHLKFTYDGPAGTFELSAPKRTAI